MPLAISIDLLDSIVFPARRRGMGALERPAQGDRLYRQTGSTMDRVDGVLLGFSEQGVRLETSLGERVFPWGEVVALFIEPLDDLDSEGATAEETAVVHLTCGSRLRGKLLAINANDIVLESGFGPWAIPYAWIHELTRLDGTFRFLSWLTPEPSAGPRSPFDPPGSEPLGMVWPAQVDRAVGGGLLRAGGRVWSHGLGVHAPSRMLWKLDGSDCSLRLSASLDDSARRGDQFGSVVFQVLVDGKEAWRSGLRQGDQAPVTPDPISLQGAQTLELIVTDGGDGPVLDRAAWLAPILVACPGSAGDRR